MTEKRFKMEYVTPKCYHIITDSGKHLDEFEILNLLNEQDQQIKETKDAFYEAHKQQQDCLKEVLKLRDEKRELEFKLNTLIKAYACQNCAFNDREMRYLKSLRE